MISVSEFAGFGHSHIVAFAKGFYALQRELAAADGSPSFVGNFHYLHSESFVPNLIGEEGGALRLNPALRTAMANERFRCIILSPGGNEHNQLSIAQVTRRFDFVLSEDPNAELDPAAEIIPEALVRETLRDMGQEPLSLIAAFGQESGALVAVMEPPPPLPSAHVLKHPGDLIAPPLSRAKISSDNLRYKVWRVFSNLCQSLCQLQNIVYIPVPQDLIDANGMLVTAGCGEDATHANEWFGRQMTKALFERIGYSPDESSQT